MLGGLEHLSPDRRRIAEQAYAVYLAAIGRLADEKNTAKGDHWRGLRGIERLEFHEREVREVDRELVAAEPDAGRIADELGDELVTRLFMADSVNEDISAELASMGREGKAASVSGSAAHETEGHTVARRRR